MRQFLTLPILVPIVLGIALLILQPKSRRVRSIYIMAASLATTALSLACIVLTYLYGSGFLACIMVRFNEAFSISLRIDGASMVYGAIVSVLWPLVTAYSLDYMSHEGHENRFFAFWLMAYGVVLGIAYSEDFLTLYFFYEVLTLTTLPLVMHAMDEKARYAGRKYLVYSLSGAAFAFIGIVFLLNYGVGHLNFTYGGILDQSLAAGNERTLELVFVAAFFGFGVKAAVFPFHGWLPDLGGTYAGVCTAPCSGGGQGRRLRSAAANLLRLRGGFPAGKLGPDGGDDGGYRDHCLRLRSGAADTPSEAAAGVFHGEQPFLHPLCPDVDDPGRDGGRHDPHGLPRIHQDHHVLLRRRHYSQEREGVYL